MHALQLLHPELAYPQEPMLSRETATTLHLATPHLTEPFISV